VCLWVVDVERPSPSASASADRNILHLLQVSLKGKEKENMHVHPWLPLSFLISSGLYFLVFISRGGDTPVSQTESTQVQEVENVTLQASVLEDAKGLICKVSLLEGELAEEHQVWDVVDGKFRNLSNASADGTRRLVVSKMEHLEQYEELSLLWAWGAELCLAIVGPSQVRSHLSVRMWAAALHHTEMVGELTTFWVTVSSAMELVLGRSPNETSRVEVMNYNTPGVTVASIVHL
jgi:hypothetical protein